MERKTVPIKFAKKYDIKLRKWWYVVYYDGKTVDSGWDKEEMEAVYSDLEKGIDPFAEVIISENEVFVK